MYLYLLLNIGAVLFPLIFSFHPKLNFYRQWKWFLPANLVIAAMFIAWDIWFTKMGIWGFNPEYVIGWSFMQLPIEEILFFICIPYASIFTLYALKNIYPRFTLSQDSRIIISLTLITFCFVCGLFFRTNLYTFTAMCLLAVSIAVAHTYLKEKLDFFYLMYAIIMLPFFIINGILTGTGIPGEVVWYNEAHIIGLRVLTIPIEDVFYGMSLLLLNVLLMEYAKNIWSFPILKGKSKGREIKKLHQGDLRPIADTIPAGVQHIAPPVVSDDVP